MNYKYLENKPLLKYLIEKNKQVNDFNFGFRSKLQQPSQKYLKLLLFYLFFDGILESKYA